MVEASWDPAAALQLRQGTDQPRWFSGKLGARGIRQGFPRARDGQLNNRTDQEPDGVESSPENDQRDGSALTLFPIGVDASGELPCQSGKQESRADDRTDDQQEQDVAILDMAELVGDNAIELIVTHHVEQASGDRQRGMPRIAPSGEGIRRRIFYDEDVGLWKAGAARQPLHRAV